MVWTPTPEPGASRRARPRTRRAIAIALAFAVALPAAVVATGSYGTQWSAHYPASSSRAGAGCQLCHAAGDTSSWNAYGQAIREQINSAGLSLTAAAVAVEGYNSDADPAGTSNLVEISAGSQPGWTAGNANTIYDIDGTPTANQPPAGTITGLLDPSATPTPTPDPDADARPRRRPPTPDAATCPDADPTLAHPAAATCPDAHAHPDAATCLDAHAHPDAATCLDAVFPVRVVEPTAKARSGRPARRPPSHSRFGRRFATKGREPAARAPKGRSACPETAGGSPRAA